MREILFRGKSRDTNKWVLGDFVSNACGISYEECLNENGDIGYIMTYVIPETVGQYTGLTDKNGKKIFEGDILKAKTLDTNSEQIAVVGFGNFVDKNNDDEYLGFYIEFDGIKTTATQLFLEEVKCRIEVIGNIHDSPKLLKEGENG